MAESEKVAEIQFTKAGLVPMVQLTVPHGTRLPEIARALAVISERISPQISPRGCQACTSGYEFLVRERFENVVNVNLGTGEVVG